MIFRSPLSALLFKPVALCDRLAMPSRVRRARAYLEQCGAADLLISGDQTEHKPVWVDLAVLHRLVRQMKPKAVIEFGVGYSTLVLSHALQANHRDAGPEATAPLLYSVDASEHWMANAMSKLPDDLKPYVVGHHSRVEACEREGEVCHLYERLPDVNPDLIYLDGPSNLDVEGDVRGLRFTDGKGVRLRPVLSADVLLLESALSAGAKVVIDGRIPNTRFLRRHLKRRWSFRPNFAEKRYILTLRD